MEEIKELEKAFKAGKMGEKEFFSRRDALIVTSDCPSPLFS